MPLNLTQSVEGESRSTQSDGLLPPSGGSFRSGKCNHDATSGNMAMTFVCDVLRSLSSACTTSQEDGAAAVFLQGVEARRRRLISGGGSGDTKREFMRAVERVLELHVPRRHELRSAEDLESIEHVMGLRLAASSRRDFRACVDFVDRGSAAEAQGIQPGAAIVSVDNKSMHNVSAEAVMGAIYDALTRDADSGADVLIEFSQPTEEVPVDKNPFQMTSFPSPAGMHLPGVKQFQEFDDREEEVVVSKSSRVLPPVTQRRRERSRSMKHFWMSDRSSKACYECEQLFTFMRRRHHCRSCGQIFCSQCCARLPQSFGGPKVDESISRLRKQLVCHTCHRQLREGLEVELSGPAAANGQAQQLRLAGGERAAANGTTRPQNSPQTSQTLMLMPPQIADALERSTSDAAQNYRQLDRTDFFNKDEISKDDGSGVARGSEQAERIARPLVLFNMFPKVQIVASVQQLTHQPRLQGISTAKLQGPQGSVRRRAFSLDMTSTSQGKGRVSSMKMYRSYRRIKRSNSLSEIGNPSNQRWDEKAEFKRILEESTMLTSSEDPSTPPALMRSRPKALSGTFTEPRFGSAITRDPFSVKRMYGGHLITRALALGGVVDNRERNILSTVGLSEDATDDAADRVTKDRREELMKRMEQHAHERIQEHTFSLLESSPVFSRIPMGEVIAWMQIIMRFAEKATENVFCCPDQGDSMDVMEYVRVKCLDGGRVQDSFFIDGVLVHKSLARKGMRSDILKPRILLIASDLDYQRRKEAIASLESVAGQEVEYMHIVAEKIMTMHPDIVMFSGHVHRVAEEILFKERVAVVKNVRMVDLQRIARCTGASLLTSYDHVDKISDKSVIGTCDRFYVMVSDYEPKSGRGFSGFKQGPNGNFHPKGVAAPVDGTRKKRPQRQNLVFEGGLSEKGCTLCLRGGTLQVFDEVTKILSMVTRAAYNMKLQRRLLLEMGLLPPDQEPDRQKRSMAEEWFAKCSSSLYLSLKSNSLSMRASLKEAQTMCKWCKDRTRYNNISSLRSINTKDEDEPSNNPAVPLSAPMGCTCSMKSANALRERILFSTCWSSLDGKNPSKAEMMCIDFCSSNDCSFGQFLERFCFASSDREFKRAFQTSQLSFSHDVGRITVRVKDLSEYKDPNERGMPAADLLRDLNHRAVLRRVRSNVAHMWCRSLDAPSATSRLASSFVPVPEEVWNYSFGKFLEGFFYGKSLSVDSVRLPHLNRVRNSRDPSLVYYFSKAGRVVSVQCEPVEPVLHVALQPVLWQDHVDQELQLAAIQELTDLAREVFDTTTAKLAESMADPLTPAHAKARLRILRNEVFQWHSCYASTIESDPPQDVFAKNARFKDIYLHAADWSLRITHAMHATVKPLVKHPENSPTGGLPRAWFDQIAGAMEREFSNFTGLTPSATMTPAAGGGNGSFAIASMPNSGGLFDPSATHLSDGMGDGLGDLESLARFARSLTTGDTATVSGSNSFSNISNEVTKTLNANGKIGSHGASSMLELSDVVSNDERDDQASRSFPGNGSSESSMYTSNNIGASTIGSVSSRLALEAFRISHQNKKSDPRGYLTIPKSLLNWHPSLPVGVKDTVILVNTAQPTSIVAFSLCSKVYTQRINAFMRKESISLETGPVNSIDTSACSSTEAAMLRMLRSTRRNNVEDVFVDDSQFQQATRFSCKSYYAMQFHALRRLYYGGDRNYVESLCHCEQWNAAGGKSGAGFLKTRDQRFIAKAIPEIEVQMFLSMANEYFSYMAKTFEDNLSSMLSKVLGIYKVTSSSDSDQKMCILVMENLLYGRDVNFSFDLKGKLEGRYRERTNSSTDKKDGPVLWDRNFIEMAGGIPLPLQESAMSLLLSAIANDTTFLASVQATDYSMLVGYDVKKQEVVASIIDYIHKYDFMKMVEHAGKRLIQDEGEITVLNPRQYRKRFCVAMTKYFVTIPSRYTKVTTMVVRSSMRESLSMDPMDDAGSGDRVVATPRAILRAGRSRSDNNTLLGLTAAFDRLPPPPSMSMPLSTTSSSTIPATADTNSVSSLGSNASTHSGKSRNADEALHV